MKKIKKYYLFSEGYGAETDEGSVSLGNLEIWPVWCVQHEDDDELELTSNADWDDIASFEQCYIDDKWGGRKVTDIPDDVEPMFTNGLIQVDWYDTWEEAKNEFDVMSNGEIEFENLDKW